MQRLRAERVLLAVLVLLVLKRVIYHADYLLRDPFALVTISDGRIYEIGARDLIAHPPLGSQPFYLQGLYSCLLALPLALFHENVAGLGLQLVLAAMAIVLFDRAARQEFGAVSGRVSTLLWMGLASSSFYENKYLSVSLGVSCNAFALWAVLRALRSKDRHDWLLAGVGAGLSVLGRPNRIWALPVYAAAWWLHTRAEADGKPVRASGALWLALGVVLALAPMALRNEFVTGSPTVFPSHGGAIPFFIGNNPHSNGRWNTAGGLITGEVVHEREQLARRLGISAADTAELDRRVSDALLQETWRYIRSEPLDWLALEAKKLWFTLGNHRFIRDYDVRGEAEILGPWHQLGLPFGLLLGLGFFGLFAVRAQDRSWPTLLVVGGQFVAVLAANVLVFTSAQNREPLAIPLAFLGGPGLVALWRWACRMERRPRTGVLVASAALAAQAFYPRLPGAPDRPSSFHYYNLGSVEEKLGRKEDSLRHYARAVEINQREPLFRAAYARAQRAGEGHEAAGAVDR